MVSVFAVARRPFYQISANEWRIDIMNVIFSNRAFAGIMAETAEKVTTETGGLFLGAVRGDQWHVVEAIDPGPKSIFRATYFEYDRAYTQHLINKVANLYEKRLELIGLWHRHPGSLDVFSSTDDSTNRKYACMRPEGAISALVNIDPVFRLTVYHVGQPCSYSSVPYEVGDDLIPPELLRYRTPESFERLMQDFLHPAPVNQRKAAVSLADMLKRVIPDLERAENVPELDVPNHEDSGDALVDALVDDLAFLSDNCGMQLSMRKNGQSLLVEETKPAGIRMEFRYWYEKECVLLFMGKNAYYYSGGAFRNAMEKTEEPGLFQRIMDQMRKGTEE